MIDAGQYIIEFRSQRSGYLKTSCNSFNGVRNLLRIGRFKGGDLVIIHARDGWEMYNGPISQARLRFGVKDDLGTKT